MKKITAIIPTFNEQHNIIAAIKSVDFADEIIVVDSFSSDKTINLATPLVDKVLQREYENSASQKNWVIPKAKYEWIFILDADERLCENIRKEIISILKYDTTYDGFWIKRKNYFMDKRVYFSGWREDKVIRLFRRDKCRYENKYVHAEIFSDGKIGFLKNKIIHNTFRSKHEYLKKIERYAKWQAKDYDGRTGKITFFHTIIKPIFRFIKHYIVQLGILDGYVGLIIANYQARAVSMRYKFLKDLRNEKRNN